MFWVRFLNGSLADLGFFLLIGGGVWIYSFSLLWQRQDLQCPLLAQSIVRVILGLNLSSITAIIELVLSLKLQPRYQIRLCCLAFVFTSACLFVSLWTTASLLPAAILILFPCPSMLLVILPSQKSGTLSLWWTGKITLLLIMSRGATFLPFLLQSASAHCLAPTSSIYQNTITLYLRSYILFNTLPLWLISLRRRAFLPFLIAKCESTLLASISSVYQNTITS